MSLLSLTSPHTHGTNKTGRLMLNVALATLPGLIALTVFFGYGTLSSTAVTSAVLSRRKKPTG